MATNLAAIERRRQIRKLRRGRNIARSHAARQARYDRAIGKAMTKGVHRHAGPASPLWDVEVWAARVTVKLNLLHSDNRRRTHPADQWAKPGRDSGEHSPTYPSDLLPYNDSAAYDWWQSLTPADRLALYEDGRGARADALNSDGIADVAIVNPAFILEKW